MESLAASSFNLLLLVGFLAYKLNRPVRDFVAKRHVTIKDEIGNVRTQLRQAQEKYDEFSAKLKAIDAEIANLREQAKQDAAAIKQKILTESRRVSSQVISDAKSSGDALFAELKSQLYSELSQRVLDRAETILRDRLTGDDQARMRAEFSNEVGSMQ